MAVGRADKIGYKPPRRARSIDVLANADGPNPFAAPSAEFLGGKRQQSASKADAARGAVSKLRGAAARATSMERRFDRDRKVLDAMDKLEDRDTRACGTGELEQILSDLHPGELSWFLKLFLNERKPLQTAKGRREQLLLLVSVVRQFGSELGDGVLFDRILPFIIHGAASKDMHEIAARVIVDIYHHLVPAPGEFLNLTPLILKKLLDPLQLGTGWDLDCKRGCIFILAALTPAVMDMVEDFGRGFEGPEGESVGALLENYTTLLVQCLAVNHDFEEGLLQCIARVAACDPESVVVHARGLAERCSAHLLDSPSQVPDFAIEDGRPESPKKAILLTRELALVCCLCLWHIAERVVPLLTQNEMKAYYNVILTALSRDNLNLYRLTRNNEQLRVAIGRAAAAWQRISGDIPDEREGDGSPVPGTWRADEQFSKGQQLSRLARPALQGAPPRETRRRQSPGPRHGSPPPAAAARGRRPPSHGLPAVTSNYRPTSNSRPASAGPRSASAGPRAASGDRTMGRLTSMRKPREASANSSYPSSAAPVGSVEEEDDRSDHSAPLAQLAAQAALPGSAAGPAGAAAPSGAKIFSTEVTSQSAQPSVLPPPQASAHPPSQPSAPPLSFDDLTNRALPMPGDISDDEDRGPPPIGPGGPLGPLTGVAGATYRPEQIRPPLPPMQPPTGVPLSRSGLSGLSNENVVTDCGWSHLREAAPDLPSYNPSLASLSDDADHEEPAWLQLRQRPRLGLKDSRPRSAPRPRTQEPRGPSAADRRNLMPCQRNGSKNSGTSADGNEDGFDDGTADLCEAGQHMQQEDRARSRAARAVQMASDRNAFNEAIRSARTAHSQSKHTQESKFAQDFFDDDMGAGVNTAINAGAGVNMAINAGGSSSSTAANPQRLEQGAAGPVPTAGPVPGLPPKSPERSPKEVHYDELPPRPPQAVQELTAEAARMLDRDAPYLTAVMRYLTAGRVDHALQCAFKYGNEKTLRSALQMLNPRTTWGQLPGDVAAYLAHIMVLLLCKDPLSEQGREACAWLEGLVRIPGGREALARENHQELRKALFCLSGVPGEGGTLASWLYYQLFQDAR